MLKNGVDAICAMDGTASQGLQATGGTVAQKIDNSRCGSIQPDEVVSTTIWQKPDFGGAAGFVDRGGGGFGS